MLKEIVMDESIIELPKMEYPVRVKTLKDYTNICTCKIKGEKKYCLVVDEMVDMIVAQRAYEMNSKAVQTSDNLLATVVNLKR